MFSAGGGSSQNVGRPDNSGFGHTTLSPVRGTTRRPRPDIPDFDNDNVRQVFVRLFRLRHELRFSVK